MVVKRKDIMEKIKERDEQLLKKLEDYIDERITGAENADSFPLTIHTDRDVLQEIQKKVSISAYESLRIKYMRAGWDIYISDETITINFYHGPEKDTTREEDSHPLG